MFQGCDVFLQSVALNLEHFQDDIICPYLSLPLQICLPSQLVLTVGLLAVVVYLYTVIAFNFFRKFYNHSRGKETEEMKCNDMLTVSFYTRDSF